MVKPTDTEIEELAESYLNGNCNFVADEIAGRSPADAAYITGIIVCGWMQDGKIHYAESLIRAIGRRIED
jgi:hypothetical protein